MNEVKVTKKAIAEYVRMKLKTDEKWAKRALLKIYEAQTEDEKEIGGTVEYNNVGFSGVDGEFYSSLAVQLKTKGWLSPKQVKYLMKRIHKYTRQIIEVSDEEKLKELVIKNL